MRGLLGFVASLYPLLVRGQVFSSWDVSNGTTTLLGNAFGVSGVEAEYDYIVS